jgi:CBS domain-containing protein
MSQSPGQRKPKVVSAREVMNKNVLKVNRDSSVRKAAELMSQRNVGSILVMDGTELAGILTERDLMNNVTAKGIDPGRD